MGLIDPNMLVPSPLQRYLCADIETIANQRSRERVEQEELEPDPKLARLDEPPSSITSLKSPDLRENRLAEWRAEQQRKAEASIRAQRAKRLDKLPLSCWTGEVRCVVTIEADTGATRVYADGDERKILTGFFADLQACHRDRTLTGHTWLGFDRPFLVGRAMALNIGVPDHLRLNSHIPLEDVTWIFGRSPAYSTQAGSLGDFAWGLGIDGKLGHGTDVARWHEAALMGDESAAEAIVSYCSRDVELVREILRRYLKPFRAEVVVDGPAV